MSKPVKIPTSVNILYHPSWYWNALAFVLHDAGRFAEALDAYSQMAQRPSFYHA